MDEQTANTIELAYEQGLITHDEYEYGLAMLNPLANVFEESVIEKFIAQGIIEEDVANDRYNILLPEQLSLPFKLLVDRFKPSDFVLPPEA